MACTPIKFTPRAVLSPSLSPIRAVTRHVFPNVPSPMFFQIVHRSRRGSRLNETGGFVRIRVPRVSHVAPRPGLISQLTRATPLNLIRSRERERLAWIVPARGIRAQRYFPRRGSPRETPEEIGTL